MPRKLYRFDGMTFVLEADSPIADSPMCEPFRVGAGEPADHTVRLTFSDRVPDPPQNALRQGPLYRWYTGSARCTLQRYSAPGRTPQFTYAETRPGHTDLVFAESYRTGASARVVLESAGLFDILADAGMLVLHSAYIVTAPLRAVVLLHQAPESRVTDIRPQEAFARVLSQCAYHQWDPASAARMTELAARLVTNVPVRQLDCRADESAVRALEEALRRT